MSGGIRLHLSDLVGVRTALVRHQVRLLSPYCVLHKLALYEMRNRRICLRAYMLAGQLLNKSSGTIATV